jgi:hypothetical protein
MAKQMTMCSETGAQRDGREPRIIRISAKALGELALPTFCPRCFWLKRKMRNKLPFRQPLPGAFSTIDSITKQVVHGYFDAYGHLPPWLAPLGDIVGYHEPPHWSRFNTVIEEHGVLLAGVADGIFERSDGSFIIVDYKTARFTPAQDALRPMYEVQLNAYALIAKRLGFAPVSGLFLVYMEPGCCLNSDHNRLKSGIRVALTAGVHEVSRRWCRLKPLFYRVRELHRQGEPPRGRPGCTDCLATQRLTEALQAYRGEWIEA